MLIREYKLFCETAEYTQSLAREFVRVAEPLRPKSAVWGLSLHGEIGRGKSTFAHAFADIVMKKYPDSISTQTPNAKKVDYHSAAGKIQIRCGDWRADFPSEYLEPRRQGFGGYDILEHGGNVPWPSLSIDFGHDGNASRTLIINAHREIEQSPAFRLLMGECGASMTERPPGPRT